MGHRLLYSAMRILLIKYLVSSQEIEWYDTICKKNLCRKQSFFELIKENDDVFININRSELCETFNNVYEAKFLNKLFILVV